MRFGINTFQNARVARAHGDGLLVAGLFFTDYPPSWEKIPPVEDLGLCDPLGEPGWLSWLHVQLRTDVLSVRVPPAELNISAFPPVLRDWVTKGLGMSSLVYATGHIKDPVPLIAKRRGLSPGGRFPPSFIHQVIIITGLNKLYSCMFSP